MPNTLSSLISNSSDFVLLNLLLVEVDSSEVEESLEVESVVSAEEETLDVVSVEVVSVVEAWAVDSSSY